MSITIHDPEQVQPVTHYLQVIEDLKRTGAEHAELRPGGDNVVWVSRGSSTCPINIYYIFRNGQISSVQVD